MFIAHVMFHVAPAARQRAFDVLMNEISAVRAMEGCRLFVPFLHPDDSSCIGIIHEWDSAAAMTTYTASAGFAAVGQTLRPMMTSAPISKRFDAQLLETVN